MTTATRRNLIAAGLIKPSRLPAKAVRKADYHTQEDVLHEKAGRALAILRKSLQRRSDEPQAHSRTALA